MSLDGPARDLYEGRSQLVLTSELRRTLQQSISMSGVGLLPTRPEGVGPVTSVYLWGRERRLVNSAARVLALQLDPRFRWVTAADGPFAGDPETDPVPGEEDSLVHPARDLVPKGGVAPELLWSYLRPNGQRQYGHALNEFLRLPDPIQEAVGALLSREPPRVLVLANEDRVEVYDRAHQGLFGQFIEWLNSHEITLVVTSTGPPLLERIDFEYSITVPPDLPQGVRSALAVCQWGDCTNCIVKQFFPGGELQCAARAAATAREEEPPEPVESLPTKT